MVTLTDIARKAGVNTSTVSRALRNDPGLNAESVDRIRTIARELHYQPKRRKNNELGPVGIICPDINGGIYPQLVNGLSSKLVEYGLECFMEISDFKAERELQLLQYWSRRKMSGIVCMTENTGLSTMIERCMRKYNIPILQIAMNSEAHNHDNIWIDEQVGINSAVDYLISLGHTEIAFIGGRTSQNRFSCVKKSLAEHGLQINKSVIKTSGSGFHCGYELMENILKEPKRPTAILAEYDDIALGAIRRAIEHGCSVPEDFSFIGFDDSDYCPFLPVSLTSIQYYNDTLCEAAFDILIKKIEDPSCHVAQSILIKPRLVIRESTAPVQKT